MLRSCVGLGPALAEEGEGTENAAGRDWLEGSGAKDALALPAWACDDGCWCSSGALSKPTFALEAVFRAFVRGTALRLSTTADEEAAADEAEADAAEATEPDACRVGTVEAAGKDAPVCAAVAVGATQCGLCAFQAAF